MELSFLHMRYSNCLQLTSILHVHTEFSAIGASQQLQVIYLSDEN